VKFDRLLDRARRLGFDAVATGHHARVGRDAATGRWRLRRGADRAKDQSYVLHMLTQRELDRVLLPVGELTKAEVRSRAAALGLRTAAKPDSQEVCFVPARRDGRAAFLAARTPLHRGAVVDAAGAVVGSVDAVELVTVGQRRGLGVAAGDRRYAVAVDVASRTVTVGGRAELLVDEVGLTDVTWVAGPVQGAVEAQSSAHGAPVAATYDDGRLLFPTPARRVAAGQSVVLYRGDEVLGGGIAA
jgi:tRNA-specific 2-thiouridylase